MDVWFKKVKVLSDVPTGYQPRTGRFGISARTGGFFTSQVIDDLHIEVNQGLRAADPLFAGSVATNLNSWSAN